MGVPWVLPLLLACHAPAANDTGVVDTSPPPTPATLLLVCAPDLARAASAYAADREARGFVVETVLTSELAAGEDLAGALRQRVADAAPDFLLLVGDADTTAPDDPAFVPVTFDSAGTPGDAPYGDLDGDEVPDIPIGRLPFRDPAQVEMYLARVQAHEASVSPGPADRAVHLFTGVGGFGEILDSLLAYVGALVVEEVVYDYDFTVTTAIPGSPFYLPDDAWADAWASAYNVGGVLQPYVGHAVDDLPLNDLATPTRGAFATFFACTNGNFQLPLPHESLGEALLAEEAGPLGVIAASVVSDPYGNAVLAREFSRVLLNERAPTIGEAFTRARYDMVYREDGLRTTMDQAASFYYDDVDALVASHVTMYNLLGDPTISPRIAPSAVVFDDPGGSLPAGSTVPLAGEVALPGFSGLIQVTLEIRRSAYVADIEPADEDDLAAAVANHAVANEKVLAEATGAVVNGRFSVDLAVPGSIPDSDGYFLKGFAWNDTLDATGNREVTVWR